MADSHLLVHLVRHGETALNAAGRFIGRTDIELTERGLEQARNVALRLAERPLSGVHSSPLLRAKQTAESIAKAHGLPVQERLELSELHHGVMEGLPYPDLATRYPELLQAWITDAGSARLPGGESLEDVRSRAWPALEEIAGSAEGEICVVSHKMALSAILCAAIGLELRHAMKLELELGSTSTLERRPGRGWRLLRLNTPAIPL